MLRSTSQTIAKLILAEKGFEKEETIQFRVKIHYTVDESFRFSMTWNDASVAFRIERMKSKTARQRHELNNIGTEKNLYQSCRDSAEMSIYVILEKVDQLRRCASQHLRQRSTKEQNDWNWFLKGL